MNLNAARLSGVRDRMRQACERSGRSLDSVRLLAVSKQQPPEALRALHDLGHRAFGENRLQEALEKQASLNDLPIQWHFIGPVQSNKTREIAARFDWVQTVDRDKALRRLGTQRPDNLPPLNICLQVNIDQEPQKNGVAPDQVGTLARMSQDFPRLRLRGLMCLPEHTADRAQTRSSFQRLAHLADDLRDEGFTIDTLSMGMSGDLELAIEEGSTLIRVGTDLFGPRPGPTATSAETTGEPTDGPRQMDTRTS